MSQQTMRNLGEADNEAKDGSFDPERPPKGHGQRRGRQQLPVTAGRWRPTPQTRGSTAPGRLPNIPRLSPKSWQIETRPVTAQIRGEQGGGDGFPKRGFRVRGEAPPPPAPRAARGAGCGWAPQLTLLRMPGILPARPPRSGMDVKGQVWLGSKPQPQPQARVPHPPRPQLLKGGFHEGCRQVGPQPSARRV